MGREIKNPVPLLILLILISQIAFILLLILEINRLLSLLLILLSKCFISFKFITYYLMIFVVPFLLLLLLYYFFIKVNFIELYFESIFKVINNKKVYLFCSIIFC